VRPREIVRVARASKWGESPSIHGAASLRQERRLTAAFVGWHPRSPVFFAVGGARVSLDLARKYVDLVASLCHLPSSFAVDENNTRPLKLSSHVRIAATLSRR
jgi:hypothetical protein